MLKWIKEHQNVAELTPFVEARKDVTPPPSVEFLDITMRDGAHVVDFSDKERIQIATSLADLGVHRIEIESRSHVIQRQSLYPPENHWKTLKTIANMGLKTQIFTQRNLFEGRAGIDQALQCDVTNIVLQEPVHMEWLASIQQTKNKRFKVIRDVIQYAKDQGCYITFFNNHIFKADHAYLLQVVQAGVDAGADSLCITDSEGLGTPQAFRFLVQQYLTQTQGRIPIEIHPHNDFGLALANTIAGYEAGASIIHCSVNGLGSRAGNTRLEEITITLHVLFNVNLGFQYHKLYDTCQLVERIQQWPIAKNKPFSGYGIHKAPYTLPYFGKTPLEK